jgi:8-oxo-dGTP pyrophosphatase MutT (NUDIX family)
LKNQIIDPYPILAVYCAISVLDDDGKIKILLVHDKDKTTPPILYKFSGGRLEKGENALGCAQREVHEECGGPLIPFEDLQEIKRVPVEAKGNRIAHSILFLKSKKIFGKSELREGEEVIFKIVDKKSAEMMLAYKELVKNHGDILSEFILPEMEY